MALRHGLFAATTAVITLLVLFGLVVPAQAAPTSGWVRGTNGDCASPVAIGEDARIPARDARFICLLSAGAAVERVEFQIDGQPAATERNAPFSLMAQSGWAPTVQPHVLRAKVVERNGTVRSFYLTVSVVGNGAPAPTATPAPTPTATPAPTGAPAPTRSPAPTVAPAPTRTPGPAPTPTSAPQPGPTRGWPGPSNTGVPAGVTLTRYTGPCDIRTPDTVIDGKLIDCDGMLVYAPGVVIRNSKVIGPVKTNSRTATLRIEDSEVDGGRDQSEAIGLDNVTVLRSNVYGNQHTVHCNSNCVVEDSWLHDQFDGKARDWHQNGFLSNGGSNITLRHNTVHCRGGCTADIALIPDGNFRDVLIENNLLVAAPDSAYCLYAGGHSGNKPGSASNIVIRDNVVQKGANNRCGTYGPVTYFRPGSGNQWINNTWEDGRVLPPAN